MNGGITYAKLNNLRTRWRHKENDKCHIEAVNDTNSDKQLIGIARCIIDFSYCCYL